MSKGYNVKINLFFASISQVLTLVFALVVPKLLINYYGPQIHGLTATISSLISYLTLVESGIGAASVQSLYAPLQERDYKLVNADLNAIAIFYLRIGKIFVTLVIVIATLYPFLSADGLDYWLVFTLVLISGLANTIEYFFTSKYRVLLQADKKLYVINLVNSVGILLQGILRIVFIYLKMSIFVVQLVPAIVYAVRLISISVYVNRAYSYLDRTVSPNFQVGKKRWSALIHQISNLVVNNTDNIVLSSTVGYTAVSIYGVYQMIISNISGFLSQALSNAVTANFGHLLYKGGNTGLCDIYDKYERLYYYIIGIIFGICSFAICPFVKLYVGNVNGIEYADERLGILFVCMSILANIRIPQLTIVTAAGHYKETQNHAICEALINIVVSIILVNVCGIYGVLIGTIASFLYRDIMFIWYTNCRILSRSIKQTVNNVGILMLIIVYVSIVGMICQKICGINSWMSWIVVCTITVIVSGCTIAILVFLFDRSIYEYVYSMFIKRSKDK